MKVIVIEKSSVEYLEQCINHAIRDKKVIDIKYSTTIEWYSALIMYEDESQEKKITEGD